MWLVGRAGVLRENRTAVSSSHAATSQEGLSSRERALPSSNPLLLSLAALSAELSGLDVLCAMQVRAHPGCTLTFDAYCCHS